MHMIILFPSPQGKNLVTFDGFLGSNRWPGQCDYHAPVCTLLCNKEQNLSATFRLVYAADLVYVRRCFVMV